jgi:deoxyribose-phosphate aldolase
LAKTIDHSQLHPTMTDDDIAQGCALARKYNVATACIKPYCIPMVRDLLAGSGVGVCPVIAFPHGNSTTSIKVKAAGGIRTLDDLLRVRGMGVTRVGATGHGGDP